MPRRQVERIVRTHAANCFVNKHCIRNEIEYLKMNVVVLDCEKSADKKLNIARIPGTLVIRSTWSRYLSDS